MREESPGEEGNLSVSGMVNITTAAKLTGRSARTIWGWLHEDPCPFTTVIPGAYRGGTREKRGQTRWLLVEELRRVHREKGGGDEWHPQYLPVASIETLQAEVAAMRAKLNVLVADVAALGDLRERVQALEVGRQEWLARLERIPVAAPLPRPTTPTTPMTPARPAQPASAPMPAFPVVQRAPTPTRPLALPAAAQPEQPDSPGAPTTAASATSPSNASSTKKTTIWTPTQMQAWIQRTPEAEYLLAGATWQTITYLALHGFIMFSAFGQLCGVPSRNIGSERTAEHDATKGKGHLFDENPALRFARVGLVAQNGRMGGGKLRVLDERCRRAWRDRWSMRGILADPDTGAEGNVQRLLRELGRFAVPSETNLALRQDVEALLAAQTQQAQE